MSGTSAELPRGTTSTPGLAASSARGKAPVRAVASVERTPIRPVTLALAAASAAGAITPAASTPAAPPVSARQAEVMVPQATSRNFISARSARRRAQSMDRARISSVFRPPYGTRAVSAKKTISSPGSSARSERTAVSPPTPVSSTPIALLSISHLFAEGPLAPPRPGGDLPAPSGIFSPPRRSSSRLPGEALLMKSSRKASQSR